MAHSALAAYQQLLPQILAFPESDTLHINLDVPTVVTTLLGAIPALMGLRPHIVEELPRFDITQVDEMEFRVLALSHAHALYLGTARPVIGFPELVQLGTKRRDIIYAEAQTLIARGLLDPTTVREVKRESGHRALAVDLQVLATSILAIYGTLPTRPLTSEQELTEALHIADQINYAVGIRDQGPQTPAEAANIRNRCYAWVFKSWDQMRRAASYLRWDEKDVDLILPSPFSIRAPRTNSKDAPAPSEPAPTTPAQPAPATAPTAPATAVPGFPVAMPFSNKT
jgi:hypothetical protein